MAPVFVYGALRSGTTLLRLMLNGHPSLHDAGEADFLFDMIRPDPSHPTGWVYDRHALAHNPISRGKGLTLPEGRDGRDLLLDLCAQFQAQSPGLVTLNVHRNAERLIALLPQARLVHLVRDPRDVARSAMGMGWAGTLYHGVDQWRQTETAWDRVAPSLSDGQVFSLSYEALLADPEGTLRALCGFLGLAYDPGMMAFHQGTTYGAPDARLAQQWRSRATPQEIALVEGKVGALMVARGYALAGAPHRPALPQRLWLRAQNRLAIWRFGMTRYGAGLYWSEKLTRLLRLKTAHARLLAQKQAITGRHKK